MKKINLFLLAIVMGTLLLVSCGTKKETGGVETENTQVKTIKIEHSLGTVDVPLNPKKVAVFDFSALDTIKALGADVEIILPKSNIPNYLEEYKSDKYVDVGDLFEPDMEKLNEFKPDLIIIGGRQASAYNDYAPIAPTIYAEVRAENFEDDFVKLNETLGEIFGKKDLAIQKIDEIKKEITEIKDLANSSKLKALIILTNDGKISAYGVGSRFGFIYDVLGVKAIDEDIKVSTHGMGIGYEYIAEKNPDILFVVDRAVVVGGTNLASNVLNNDLIKGTNASKNNKIIYLNPSTWYLSGHGLESLPMMLEEVKGALK